mmetsp:Transcript_46936/g.109007  ORF Transcript_46936/g.109007 Transcript_46936/m.109007 type:complete len:95 (-) Transcript_46936:628-912(-)
MFDDGASLSTTLVRAGVRDWSASGRSPLMDLWATRSPPVQQLSHAHVGAVRVLRHTFVPLAEVQGGVAARGGVAGHATGFGASSGADPDGQYHA